MSFESHASPQLEASLPEERETLDPAGTNPRPPQGAPEADAEATGAITEPDLQVSVAPIWLQRLSLLMLVLFCVYLGVLVAILPWWTRVWDQNLFINSHPAVAAILHNGAVRGLVSGLGLLDVWIGVSEAIHYRDQRV
jgi:hypothetical protein